MDFVAWRFQLPSWAPRYASELLFEHFDITSEPIRGLFTLVGKAGAT
jgi:hypothetical protein